MERLIIRNNRSILW